MKRIFTLFAFLCAFSVLSAQTIPNADFEQWIADSAAVGWTSSFTYQGMLTSFNYSAGSKSSNSHSGYFAMGLHPHSIDLMLTSYQLPGVCHLGTFNPDFDITSLLGGFGGGTGGIIEGMVEGGISCNQVPQSVKAWIRYVPSGDDEMSITVRCLSNGEVVAEGTYTQTNASYGYEQITVPFSTTSSTTPDQMNIIFNCGSQEGTELFIDDVEVVMGGNGISENANVVFSVSPNPTSDVMTINPTVNGSYGAVLFDMGGKTVWEGSQLNGATQVDVTALSEGVYFLKVTANGLSRTQKVVVR